MKKQYLAFLFGALNLAAPLQGMEWAGWAAKGCATLYKVILLGEGLPALVYDLKYPCKERLEKPNASNEVQGFVRASLYELGYEEDYVKDIFIKVDDDLYELDMCAFGMPYCKVLFVPNKAMGQALEDNDQERLISYKGTLGHEMGHIVNNDNLRKILYCFKPALVYGSVRLGTYCVFRALGISWPGKNYVAKGIDVLLSTLLAVKLKNDNVRGRVRFDIQKERKADQQLVDTCSDPSVLRMQASEYRWSHANFKEFILNSEELSSLLDTPEKQQLFDEASPESTQLRDSIRGQCLKARGRYNMHPNELDRALFFEAAADKLEKCLS